MIIDTMLNNLPPLPIIILIVVFILVAVRKIGKYNIPIWLIMSLAAVIVVLTNNIGIFQAYLSIDFEVIFYLFGVFIIGQALESSNYLEYISLKIFNRATNLSFLLFMIIMIFGLASALLMNDTIAIIATPVILVLAKQHNFDPKPFY